MIAGAAIWISIVLLGSGLLLSHILQSLVALHFEHDLQDHARELGNLVEISPELKPYLPRDFSDPSFLHRGSGHYWQVLLRNGSMIRSPSLGADTVLPTGPEIESAGPTTVDGPTGPMRLIRRFIQAPHLDELIDIRVAADERLISDEMRSLHTVLATSLGLMAFGMVGTAYAQVAFGLRPLARIRHAISAVRSGEVTHVPEDLPHEVMPLVRELNGMISANLAMVERSRSFAGNLAHGLKMPLAVLALEARQLAASGHGESARLLDEQCARMALLIDYQTARARASALKNAGTSASIAETVKTVIDAYSRLPAGQSRQFEVTVATDTCVVCDPNDLTEIIGNLVDNAAKWSRGRILITTENVEPNVVLISVEDDGPGIPEDQYEHVFEVGARLDEEKPGTGLGLAITRDLVLLYDGRVWIERSQLGGAAVKLTMLKRAPSPISVENRSNERPGSFLSSEPRNA
ncbi:MAG: HAMP domain-containing sensor histidine kinase [Bradyrhizobium sp.]